MKIYDECIMNEICKRDWCYNNFGMRILKNKLILLIILLIAAGIVVLMGRQYLLLKKAHSTFENYYAFRGCTQLVKKTDAYGICKLSSGQEIKIVKFNNKWYLNGDLPWACVGKICFGI